MQVGGETKTEKGGEKPRRGGRGGGGERERGGRGTGGQRVFLAAVLWVSQHTHTGPHCLLIPDP